MKNKDHHPPHSKHHDAANAQPAESAAAAADTPPAAAAAGQPPAPETAAPPPVPEPSPVQTLAAEAADFRDKWLRSRADLENYRKRVQRDQQELRLYEKSAAITAFLSVMDHFEMASEHFEKAADLKALKEGMNLIQAEFRRALSSLGVEPVEAAGQTFDPNLHQAVTHEASDSVAAGQVLRQWKAGYRLGDRLLRPATVVVSSGPPQKPPAAGAASDKDASPAG